MTILLNPRVWIALALAILLGWAGIHLYRAGEESVQQKWDAQKLADEQQARAEETRRQSIADKEASDAQERIAKLETDLAGARAGADRLRAAVSSAIKNPKPSTGGAGQSGADTLDVLAGVLSRHSDELVSVGEYADRLRIAGLACERLYTGLHPAP